MVFSINDTGSFEYLYRGKNFTQTSYQTHKLKCFKSKSTKICIFSKNMVLFFSENYIFICSFVFALAIWKVTDKVCLITVILFCLGIWAQPYCLFYCMALILFILALMILFYGFFLFVLSYFKSFFGTRHWLNQWSELNFFWNLEAWLNCQKEW